MTLCVAKRTRSVPNGMRRGASHDSGSAIIVPHAPAWERSSRRSASHEDAERPERHDDAERRTIMELSVQTDAELQHDSWDYRSSRSSVGMQFATLCVAR